MNTFRVVFTYESPSPGDLEAVDYDDDHVRYFQEKDAVLEAPNAERAAVDALLQGLLPAYFVRGEPIYWSISMAGKDRWPTVVEPGVIAWGDPHGASSVTYTAEQWSSDSKAAER